MAPEAEDLPRAVLERAARGDPRAFEAIVRRFERPVFSLVRRLTGNDETARELAQDVFLKCWRNLSRYDPDRPFAPWFLKLAANLALNARAAAKLRKTETLDGAREPGDPVAVPQASLAATREASDAVRQAVGGLDPRYALPVVLFYLEGLSVKEIAARLELPEGTVKIRLHRARDLLKETLARFGREA